MTDQFNVPFVPSAPVNFANNFRRRFADSLFNEMKKNPNIFLITGDLGYKMWDDIVTTFPERIINPGAAEQSMIGIAVGLALSAKIPVVYSITPFLLYRPFETIRNYINHERIPVKLIGSGRDNDYIHDGFSHLSNEDREVMNIFSNIKSFWPDDVESIAPLVSQMISDSSNPWYINLKR